MVTVVIPTDWTSVMTAVGTVGAAAAAVGIAIWADLHIGQRQRQQFEHSGNQLAEQFRESKQLAEDQARPFVVVTLEPSGASHHFFDLVVRNRGMTVARDVKFSFDKPLQSTIDNAGYPIASVRFLRDGITIFAPGAEYRVLFDSMPDRYQASLSGNGLPDSYAVTVRYKDRNGKALPVDEYVLDSSLSRSAPFAQEFRLHDLVKEVAELRETFKAWADSDR